MVNFQLLVHTQLSTFLMNEKWPYTQDSTLQDIFYGETQFVNYTHQPPNNSFKTQLSLKKTKTCIGMSGMMLLTLQVLHIFQKRYQSTYRLIGAKDRIIYYFSLLCRQPKNKKKVRQDRAKIPPILFKLPLHVHIITSPSLLLRDDHIISIFF